MKITGIKDIAKGKGCVTRVLRGGQWDGGFNLSTVGLKVNHEKSSADGTKENLF